MSMRLRVLNGACIQALALGLANTLAIAWNEHMIADIAQPERDLVRAATSLGVMLGEVLLTAVLGSLAWWIISRGDADGDSHDLGFSVSAVCMWLTGVVWLAVCPPLRLAEVWPALLVPLGAYALAGAAMWLLNRWQISKSSNEAFRAKLTVVAAATNDWMLFSLLFAYPVGGINYLAGGLLWSPWLCYTILVGLVVGGWIYGHGGDAYAEASAYLSRSRQQR